MSVSFRDVFGSIFDYVLMILIFAIYLIDWLKKNTADRKYSSELGCDDTNSSYLELFVL